MCPSSTATADVISVQHKGSGALSSAQTCKSRKGLGHVGLVLVRARGSGTPSSRRRLLVAVAHELCAGRVAHQVEAATAQQRARAVASQTAAELVELHEEVAKRERRGVGELRAKRWLEQIGLYRIQVVARLRYVGEHAHHGFARLDEFVACEPALLDVRKPVAHRRRGTRRERIDVRSAARRGGAGSEAEERRKDVQHAHTPSLGGPSDCPEVVGCDPFVLLVLARASPHL